MIQIEANFAGLGLGSYSDAEIELFNNTIYKTMADLQRDLEAQESAGVPVSGRYMLTWKSPTTPPNVDFTPAAVPEAGVKVAPALAEAIPHLVPPPPNRYDAQPVVTSNNGVGVVRAPDPAPIPAAPMPLLFPLAFLGCLIVAFFLVKQ